MLTEQQLARFRADGFLVLREVLDERELAALRAETLSLVEQAACGTDDPDFKYRAHELTGEQVPYRIEYVVDKTASCKALLGHPYLLEAVEQLQGPRFIPTWDSMVFKQAGAGAAIPWHRDAGREYTAARTPIFNVDVYLDGSDRSNCLWALPGSQLWSDEEAGRAVASMSEGGFRTEGAVPLELAPGDVVLHDILVVHGSPPSQSSLRRVLYLEFRPAELELELGPHVAQYVPLKQSVLLRALAERGRTSYGRDEEPFVYRGELAAGADRPRSEWRFPHEEYWREAA
ncbi:MAG TPA: phytanoyl-CoA dioxygenase family protein [Gaiellaceae bacterium]